MAAGTEPGPARADGMNNVDDILSKSLPNAMTPSRAIEQSGAGETHPFHWCTGCDAFALNF
jgi:hypothetical protein